ncbi:MAG TPA: pyridoxamine 5'-phosphate oxidase family protein, partial [Burkholderiales bacterium]|nr:pyridoxamine 5'-phosphate oxidase family protein [Burkholderiales bacterium]
CGVRPESMTQELADLATEVIDSNRYMALGTANDAGIPWVSPVWFATEDYRRFHWVSSPEARHSVNIAARAEVAIAIFDSSAAPGCAEAVYISARAEELTAPSSSVGSSSSIECRGGTSRASGA